MGSNSYLPAIMGWGISAFTATVQIAVLVGVWMIIRYALRRRKEHERRIRNYAQWRGWGYAHADPGIAARFARTAPFGRGGYPLYANIVRYQIGSHAGYSFDFSCQVSSGRSTGKDNRAYYHVVSLDLPVALPEISVRPEGGLRGLAEFFGITDIQFESGDFNRRWHVSSPNRLFAFDLIHPRMIEWLMQDSQLGANFAIEGNSCFTIIEGQQQPERIDAMVGYLAAFIDQVPQFVWDKARG